MGQAAKSNIRIEFNTGVPLGLTSATATHQTLLDFYKNSRNDDLATPSITVVEHELYDTEVELTLYSTRRINLDFQVDLLQEYLDTIHSDIVEEVNEDTWVQA